MSRSERPGARLCSKSDGATPLMVSVRLQRQVFHSSWPHFFAQKCPPSLDEFEEEGIKGRKSTLQLGFVAVPLRPAALVPKTKSRR